jgi:hypothetical protein
MLYKITFQNQQNQTETQVVDLDESDMIASLNNFYKNTLGYIPQGGTSGTKLETV